MTCKLSGGNIVDLVENGSQIQVTYANLSKYIELTIKARLNEAQQQIDWIKRGININFRSHLLRIFTWQELETKVIGDAKFDVEQFETMSSYKGCNKDDEVIRLFWKILSEFDQTD
jgi:E3 ubiquitin-protein ligase NEDD4